MAIKGGGGGGWGGGQERGVNCHCLGALILLLCGLWYHG